MKVFVVLLFCVLLSSFLVILKFAMVSKRRWQERKKALLRMKDHWFEVYYYNLDRSKVKRREKKVINQEIKRRKLKLKLL